MRFSTSLFGLAALLGTASASPIEARQSNLVRYRLRVSFDGIKELDGKYLSIDEGKIGVYNTAMSESNPFMGAVEWYPVAGASKGTWEMHTYPIGIVDHTLALVGTNGLYSFVDLTNPAATTFPVGTAALWSEWCLKNFPPITIQCVPAISDGSATISEIPEVPRDNLVYYGGKGAGNEHAGWQAFPTGNNEWDIKWNNGSAIVPAIYMPIDVVWEIVPIKCA